MGEPPTHRVLTRISITFVSIVSVLALGYCLLLFFNHLFLKNLINTTTPSKLAVKYLNQSIRIYPKNTDLKFTLARLKLELGQIQEAKQIIAPYLNNKQDVTNYWKAEFVQYLILRAQTYKMEPNSKMRLAAENQLKTSLLYLLKAPSFTTQQSLTLAHDALANERPDIAMQFYQKAYASSKNNLSLEEQEGAARAALYVGQYETSAHYYELALAKQPSYEKRKQLFIQAIQSLISGNKPHNALLFAERYEKYFRRDSKIWLYLTNVAQAANQPTIASRYIQRALLYHGNQYDEPLYNTAYTVYLANQQVKSAFLIAKTAVEHHRSSKLWRMRLAQTAIWLDMPEIAEQQYLYLAQNNLDNEALHLGIKLAQSVGDDTMLIQFLNIGVKREKNKVPMITLLIDAHLRAGDIQIALQILNRYRSVLGETNRLSLQQNIATVMNDVSLKKQSLINYSQLHPLSPSQAASLAKIYLSERNPNKAYDLLHQATRKAKPDDANFWRNYGQIALLTHHTDSAIHAFKLLLKYNPDASIYSAFIGLIIPYEMEYAYQVAKQGVTKYPNNVTLAMQSFTLNLSLNRWRDFSHLNAIIPPKMRKELLNNSDYIKAKANYLEHTGKHVEAVATYLNGIHRLPQETSLPSDFIYFLIKSFDLQRLAIALNYWYVGAANQPELWASESEGYAKLNHVERSRLFLQLFYNQFDHNQKDPVWLITLKDLLENSFLPSQAWAITHYTWSIYLPILHQQTAPLDYNQQLNYVKISMQEAPGDITRAALSSLQRFINEDVELLMLTWSMKHNDFALSDQIVAFYQQANMSPPAWVSLTLAMYHYDRQKMRAILTDSKKIASYRDQVQAALNIDATPVAQTIAFQQLNIHRKDSSLYDQYFTPAMMQTANQASVSQQFYQYGVVIGPRTVVSYTNFIWPSLSLKPYSSSWFSGLLSNQSGKGTQNNTQQLQSAPSIDERVGMLTHLRQHRGSLDIDLGYRKNLTSFLTFKGQRNYNLRPDLSLSLALGYHQESSDTAGMLVGGMKNMLGFNGVYTISSKDSVLFEYAQNFFYTQDGQYVSNGLQPTVRYEHKLFLDYPDYTGAIYATGANYFNQTTRPLQGSILSIIPPQVPPTVNFLIPKNFFEYGASVGFGLNKMDEYAHAWHAFGSYTLSKNTVIGIGKMFNFGAAGSVFGRDHLLLYYEQGTNAAQGIQISRLAKLTYIVYC